MIYLFTLLREDSFREGFNPFLDPSLLAHVVDLILFPETEGQTVEPHFESRDGRKNEVEADRERREKERRSRDTRLYTRSTVFRAPSLSLSLSLLVEVLALARFCIRRKSVDSSEREH